MSAAADPTPRSHRGESAQAAPSPTDREVAEMAEFIVGLAHEPATDGLIRRAVRNVYNLGRTHEALDQVQRMQETQQMMLRGGGVVSALSILEAARALLAQPGAWTQGDSARGENGKYADPESRAAVCWCATGACVRVSRGDFMARNAALELLDSFVLPDFCNDDMLRPLAAFNDADNRSVDEVLAIFDKAIAAERAKVAA